MPGRSVIDAFLTVYILLKRASLGQKVPVPEQSF
jgi:hypothetical protein